jgi:hypothetical protein
MNIRVSESVEHTASVVAPDPALVEAGVIKSHAASDEDVPVKEAWWPAVLIGFAVLVTIAWNGALLWLVSRMLFS